MPSVLSRADAINVESCGSTARPVFATTIPDPVIVPPRKQRERNRPARALRALDPTGG